MRGEIQAVNEAIRDNEFSKLEVDIISLIRECSVLKGNIRKKEQDAKAEINNMLLSLLEVMDAFDRVFLNIEGRNIEIDKQTKIWIGNFRSVRRLFEKVLKESGVTAIEAHNGKAIPGYHHIIETKQVEGLEDDMIIEEKQKGHLRFGEVLRKSQVITVKN